MYRAEVNSYVASRILKFQPLQHANRPLCMVEIIEISLFAIIDSLPDGLNRLGTKRDPLANCPKYSPKILIKAGHPFVCPDNRVELKGDKQYRLVEIFEIESAGV